MKLSKKLYIIFIRPFKHLYQRITRGFDDSDLWNLDQTISGFVYPRLLEFVRKQRSLNNADPLWQENLEKIVTTFKLLNEKQPHERSKIEEEFIKSGLQLFADNFETLWD